jgi:hypothetical protein
MVTVGLVWVNFCPALWVNYTPAVTVALAQKDRLNPYGYQSVELGSQIDILTFQAYVLILLHSL